ncbi:MAG: SAVED domain-containing protein [Polyangiaceae bacterium]|nr:SAVED domain-containing protein [Polyangiaceae bacterium]
MTTGLKILVLSANPKDTDWLRLDREVRGIKERLRAAARRDVDVVTYEAVRPGDLQRILLQEKPHIVHFSGHGLRTEEILLEDAEGRAKPVSKEALVELFAVCQDAFERRICAVVLNACHSAAQAEAISAHVDYTIGMSGTIQDAAAVEFSAAFYGAIAEGITPDRAFRLGKNQIGLEGLGGAETLSLRIRPEIRPPVRVLLHLDLATDNPIAPGDLERHLPERTDHTLGLRAQGVRPTPNGSDLDWPACDAAIRELCAAARALAPPDRAIRYYVAGRAALPVFALLGLELSPWADVTLLNRRRCGVWDIFPVDGPPPPDCGPFFTNRRGLDQLSDVEGRVAVFVSTQHPLVPERIEALFRAEAERLAGIVELRAGSSVEGVIDAARAPAAMAEIADACNRLPAAYPRRTGVALFIAGPATLAFMAGRALNPRVLRDVWLPNYDGQAYRPALRRGGCDRAQ